MNSKLSAQILYSSFVLLLIIVESLQSPISEDKRSHKLMRFGRANHQLMHFGKRTPRAVESTEDETQLLNEANDYLESLNEELNKKIEARNAFYDIFKEFSQKDNGAYQYPPMPFPERRSGPSKILLPSRKQSFFKKAENRDNVFMHFG